jgi:hypothetical protein
VEVGQKAEAEPESYRFLHLYINAHRYYGRIGSMIYSSHSGASRGLHTMNSFTQFTINIAIVVGLIELKGIEDNLAKILFAAFLGMRICQMINGCMQSCADRSGKAV